MKKLLFACVTMLCLSSCSWFDSEPIEPKILGYGNLAYDQKTDLHYVMIDSVRYNVAHMVVKDDNPRSYSRTQNLTPVTGAEVTIFTSKQHKYPECLMGRKDVAEIEKIYKTNCTLAVIWLIALIGFVVVLFGSSKTEKVRIVHAD